MVFQTGRHCSRKLCRDSQLVVHSRAHLDCIHLWGTTELLTPPSPEVMHLQQKV